MLTEHDLTLSDGRILHVYDTGVPNSAQQLVVFWHHGTMNIGSPPAPLFPASDRLGIRWVSYDRPGYGGSSPNPNRDIASAASYTAQVADGTLRGNRALWRCAARSGLRCFIARARHRRRQQRWTRAVRRSGSRVVRRHESSQ